MWPLNTINVTWIGDRSMPVLDNKFMMKQLTSDGKTLFEYITEDALRREAESNPAGQALENLKEAYRSASTAAFQSLTTNLNDNSSFRGTKIYPHPDGDGV